MDTNNPPSMDTNKINDVYPLQMENETETEEEIQKKRRLQSPSSITPSSSSPLTSYDDMQPCEDMQLDLHPHPQPQEASVYFEFVEELQVLLPSCWLLWSKDWTYLLKKIDPSSPDLASFCQWFLSIAPEPYKEGANQVVKLIITSETSLATEMSTDHQSASYLLERVLDSKCALLIYQACRAIVFLCWIHVDNYKDLSFSDGVLNKLFNLVERKSSLFCVRHAICSIACVDKRVKAKIITETKYDTRFKWPFLFGDAEEVEHVCIIVASIVGGLEKDDATWDQIEGFLIPPIVDVMRKARIAADLPVLVATAYAISCATASSTQEQIKKLFMMDCLEVLFITIGWSPLLTSHILYGIEDFLVSKDSLYYNWIKYDKDSPGWEVFKKVEDESLFFPCNPNHVAHSIEYRALRMSLVYGDHNWYYLKDWCYGGLSDDDSDGSLEY